MNIESVNNILYQMASLPEQHVGSELNTLRSKSMELYSTDEVFKLALALHAMHSDSKKTTEYFDYYGRTYNKTPEKEESYNVAFDNMLLSFTTNDTMAALYKLNAFCTSLGRKAIFDFEGAEAIKLVPMEYTLEMKVSNFKKVDCVSDNEHRIKVGFLHDLKGQVIYFQARENYEFLYIDPDRLQNIYRELPDNNWIPFLETKLFRSFPYDIDEDINVSLYDTYSDINKKACLNHYCRLNNILANEQELNVIMSLQLSLTDSVSFLNVNAHNIANDSLPLDIKLN